MGKILTIMRKLIQILLGIYFTISFHSISAQSEGYVIESFQDVYSELTDYESIALLNDGSPIWDHYFQLDFQFPFYGNFYDEFYYRTEAWGSVTIDEDLAFFLMDYSRAYQYHVEDLANITSDVRFSHVEANNIQALVIQFTKVGFFADPFGDSLDTYMNFQLWFFENGVMEVHFGEMHMDNTPIYAPGKGFYCYGNGELDSTELCGPHVSISNPFDEEDGIAVSGAYNDFEASADIYSNLTVIPPPGWIIRFKPKSVGIFDPKPHANQIAISPNPVNSFINIPEIGNYITLYDFSGQIIFEGIVNENKFNISSFPSGIYLIRITSGGNSSIGKFFKA